MSRFVEDFNCEMIFSSVDVHIIFVQMFLGVCNSL